MEANRKTATTAVSKIHGKLREGKGSDQVRTGALGEVSEERGSYMRGEQPWGGSFSSHRLGSSALGSNGKTSPFGWLEG